jgi:hypothetical protein
MKDKERDEELYWIDKKDILLLRVLFYTALTGVIFVTLLMGWVLYQFT